MEKARDFATLRDADQLLQSEGFYASFFFGFLVRGNGTPQPNQLRQRQDKVMAALAEMLTKRTLTPETPFLLEFLESYRRLFPEEAGEALDVFLDLTHGVFAAPEATSLWREHYLAALRLDLRQLGREKIDAARERWRSTAATEPKLLYSRLGPQLRCEVAGTHGEPGRAGHRRRAFDGREHRRGGDRPPGSGDHRCGGELLACGPCERALRKRGGPKNPRAAFRRGSLAA